MANQNQINHQNFFSTNLTSGTVAGATTTPLNSIPTIAAPFYLTLDATGINGHQEVIYVTSKTATNVNHAATSYDHTTAEEVRMDIVTEELDNLSALTYGANKFTYGNAPQGFLLNGKLSVTVASNNLTVALKTLAGTDPSSTDPVRVRIGDTVRSITAALSVTKNAATNWCNSGSSELATKEIDYFVYLGYNATDGVVIGFSRIPFATSYGDFSVTTTNEKYAAISTISNAVSTDYYENVGRFAATLSAGAGYTWSVPTFTAINLIQRPIYETRTLNYTPTVVFSNPPTSSTTVAQYIINKKGVFIRYKLTGTANGSNAGTTVRITLPITPIETDGGGGLAGNGSWTDGATFTDGASSCYIWGVNNAIIAFASAVRKPTLVGLSALYDI